MSPLEVPAKGKKRKRDTMQDETDSVSRILVLENQVIESRKYYNNIVTILKQCWGQSTESDNEESTVAVVALYRIFCRLMALGRLAQPRGTLEAEVTIVQWLNARYIEYKNILLTTLSQSRSNRQRTALTLLMRLVKEEATHLKPPEDALWRTGTFVKVLKALLDTVNPSADVLDEFAEEYVQKYDDIRFYTFAQFRAQVLNEPSDQAISNVLIVLAAVDNVPDSQDEFKDFFLEAPSKSKHELFSIAAHKKQAQETWLAILRHELNKKQRKKVLGMISRQIAPWFLKVELLMDFLTDSFNEGGSTSLMALSGLFHLIQTKNLDYPHFYHKLYSLLDPNLMHSKQRSRFMRLLETFLSSTHLPAALVASFIKKMSRLALNAPPAAIVVVVPFIYNLLKSHPMCTFMIHRNLRTPWTEDNQDAFQMNETDPVKTNAIESSLWEIHSLQDHYHPNVATIAKIISEQFTKQAYNIEDFLDHSYDSMLRAELSKDLKKPPEIEYVIPKKIFNKYEEGLGQEDSVVVKLFSFS